MAEPANAKNPSDRLSAVPIGRALCGLSQIWWRKWKTLQPMSWISHRVDGSPRITAGLVFELQGVSDQHRDSIDRQNLRAVVGLTSRFEKDA